MGFDDWLDLMTFAGILILAVPVIMANERKRDAFKWRAEVDDTWAGELADEIRKKKMKASGWWRPIDETCLYIGYFLLLGASFLRFFD